MKIIGTSISMIRGDSESITISLQDIGGNPMTFQVGDTVYFTIKEHINTVIKMLQKVITVFDEEGHAIIEIDPIDTKEWRCKDYVYDVQLNSANGNVTTIIPPSKFKLEGEVTYE